MTYKIVERLRDAADEKLCLVWYDGHPLPLIGTPTGEDYFIMRGSPFGDGVVMSENVDAVLPLARIEALAEALEHIGEYWNGALTFDAMKDALEHISTTVDAALSNLREGGGQ